MPAILRDSEVWRGRVLGTTYTRDNKTESYVSVPPALLITDSGGVCWTIGNDYVQKGWTFYFGVLRNDVHTGELACRLEYRAGRVRALTPEGWRTWRERSRTEKIFSSAPGYWV